MSQLWPGKKRHESNCLSRQGSTDSPMCPCTCGIGLTDEQRRNEILALARQFDQPDEAIFTLSAAIAACLALSDDINTEADVHAALEHPIIHDLTKLAISAFRAVRT